MARTLVALCTVLGLGLLACSSAQPLPNYGKVPGFALRDHQGRTATQELFSGKVTVVDFIFTRCPDVCPMLTQQLAGLRARLPSDPALAYLSISVDPEYDTPERLQAFAKQHKALHPNWLFLTGNSDDVKRVVVSGFKQAMQAQPASAERPVNVLHGTHFVLVDQRGELRGFYRSEADGVAPLTAAVKSLLEEKASP
jgi:protein SCO1